MTPSGARAVAERGPGPGAGRWLFAGLLAAGWLAVFAVGLQRSPAGNPGPGMRLSTEALIELGALKLPLDGPGQAFRLLTTLLVHIDLLHLLGSLGMLALVSGLGPGFSARPGGELAQRLATFLLGGLAASLGSMLLYGDGARPLISAGPSGALLALLVRAGLGRAARGHEAPRSFRLLALGCVLLVLGWGLWAWTRGDHAAHLAGLGCGGLLALASRRR